MNGSGPRSKYRQTVTVGMSGQINQNINLIVFDQRQAGKSKMSAAIALEAFWRVWELKLRGAKAIRQQAT